MSKKGRPKVLAQQDFPAWKTASSTQHEKIGYSKVGASLLQSGPFNDLSSSTQIVYVKLLAISHDDAGFSISYGNMKRHWKVPKSTFQRALKDLENAGFIERVEDELADGKPQYQTQIYRYSTEWKKRLTDEERRRFRGA